MSEDHIWKVAQSVGFDDYELRPMLEAFAALAQQAQEPVGDRYFSYSTDMGFEEFATQQEAIDCSNIQIKHYREDAIRDDEWPDEVDSVCWGVILGRSKEIDTSDEDHESVDYKLYTTPPAPQPAAPVVSDEQIKETIDCIDWSQMVTADDYMYMIARAILALRLAVEPMTPEQINEMALQEEFLLVCDGVEELTEIVRAVEAHHGITAKAEDAHQGGWEAMSDRDPIWDALKHCSKEKFDADRQRFMVDAIGADDGGWTKHTQWHWSRIVAGKRLDYWPSRKKYQLDGKVMRGNVMAFVNKFKDHP